MVEDIRHLIFKQNTRVCVQSHVNHEICPDYEDCKFKKCKFSVYPQYG